MVGIGLGLNRSGKVVSIPGKLFGAVRVGNILKGGLTNSLKGSVSAGAVLAGALSLHVALAGTIPSNAALSGALTAGASAALDLPFSTMSSGADLTAKGVTYTSSGLGTQYDSTGRVTWKPNNLALYSDDLTNSTWDAYSPSISRTTNTITFSGSGNDFLFQSQAWLEATQNFIFSATISSPTLTSITIGSAGATTPVSVTSTPTRVSVVLAHNAAVIPGFDNRAAYGGSGVAGVLTVSNVQLEAVTYQTTPRPYVATTSAAYYGPRFDYDPVTLQPKGLLIEEARTNLFYPSDLSGMVKGSGLTLTTGVSDPAGTNTAITLTATTSSTWNGTNYYYKALVSALTGGSTYASSVWMRRRSGTGIVSFSGCNVVENDVTLTATWQRIVVVQTALSTTLNFQIDVLTSGDAIDIAFGQVELGSFATSYIPTTSASVTRAAETASMTGTNFSSWYNQSEGTIVTEFISGPSDARPAMLVGSMVAETPFIMQQFAYGSGQIGFSVFDGAGYQASLLASGASGISHKFAGAYKANDFAAALDGGSVLTDTAGTVPTIVALRIGSYSTAGDKQIWIKSLTYYNTRKSDAELQSLTT